MNDESRGECVEGERESLVGALTRVNEVARLAVDEPLELDPVQQLGYLRAALASHLRLVRIKHGPAGESLLAVPTDTEIITEVLRLRDIAENAAGGANAD